jgi:tetratricopeptide (TPR) repeat protein
LAYVGLAEYYDVLPDYTYTSNNESSPKLKAAATKALSIDETQPEAHALLAGAYDNEWDWGAAAREYERALQLDPNSSRTNVLYGLHFLTLGKPEDAFAHFQRGQRLDPLNLNAMCNLGGVYFNTGHYNQAITQLNKALEIDTNYPNTHLFLSITYDLQGKYDLWLEEWEKYAILSHDEDALALAKAVHAEFSRSGYRAAVQRWAEVLQEQSKSIYIDPEAIAEPYAVLGDKDKAFLWLEKAYSEKSDGLRVLKLSKYFDSLRADPRYAHLLRRMNNPQ